MCDWRILDIFKVCMNVLLWGWKFIAQCCRYTYVLNFTCKPYFDVFTHMRFTIHCTALVYFYTMLLRRITYCWSRLMLQWFSTKLSYLQSMFNGDITILPQTVDISVVSAQALSALGAHRNTVSACILEHIMNFFYLFQLVCLSQIALTVPLCVLLLSLYVFVPVRSPLLAANFCSRDKFQTTFWISLIFDRIDGPDL